MQFNSGLNSSSARILEHSSKMQVLCHFHQGIFFPCPSGKRVTDSGYLEVSHELDRDDTL